MPSLDETFQSLHERLHESNAIDAARSDPLFYLVHDPAETFMANQKLGVFASRLRNEGHVVELVSFSMLLWEIIEQIRLVGDAERREG